MVSCMTVGGCACRPRHPTTLWSGYVLQSGQLTKIEDGVLIWSVVLGFNADSVLYNASSDRVFVVRRDNSSQPWDPELRAYDPATGAPIIGFSTPFPHVGDPELHITSGSWPLTSQSGWPITADRFGRMAAVWVGGDTAEAYANFSSVWDETWPGPAELYWGPNPNPAYPDGEVNPFTPGPDILELWPFVGSIEIFDADGAHNKSIPLIEYLYDDAAGKDLQNWWPLAVDSIDWVAEGDSGELSLLSYASENERLGISNAQIIDVDSGQPGLWGPTIIPAGTPGADFFDVINNVANISQYPTIGSVPHVVRTKDDAIYALEFAYDKFNSSKVPVADEESILGGGNSGAWWMRDPAGDLYLPGPRLVKYRPPQSPRTSDTQTTAADAIARGAQGVMWAFDIFGAEVPGDLRFAWLANTHGAWGAHWNGDGDTSSSRRMALYGEKVAWQMDVTDAGATLVDWFLWSDLGLPDVGIPRKYNSHGLAGNLEPGHG